MNSKNLKHKAISSVVWTSLQRYSLMGVNFISGIILARLLTPFDYGCIGMLSIFMVLAEAFIDGGFGAALIQKKKPTPEDYSTIFYWNIFMALVMYIILFCCAPAISRFYNIPLLCDVLRVQGIILFIYAFNIIQRNQLRKTLNFKLISIVSIVTSVLTLCVTVFLAYKGFGVWALVASNIISSAIPAIVFWFSLRWRPIFVFSKKSLKELFGFGLYMFLSHMINTFSQQLQGLLIGKVYNASTLGYYSKAHSTESVASHSISSVLTQITYPLYSLVQDDLVAMSNMIKRITSTIAYFTFPIMFILILTATPIFSLLYSDRWLPSVPYFQVLCLAGLVNCLMAVNLQPIAAIGKSKVMFSWTIVKRVVGIGAVVVGLMLWGMKGLLLGVLINSYFAYFINILLVSKYIGYKWQRQISDLLPVGVASTVIAGICYLVGYFLQLNMYLDGVVKIVLYVVLYLGWSFIFKPESYQYSLTVIPAKFRFWEKKK